MHIILICDSKPDYMYRESLKEELERHKINIINTKFVKVHGQLWFIVNVSNPEGCMLLSNPGFLSTLQKMNGKIESIMVGLEINDKYIQEIRNSMFHCRDVSCNVKLIEKLFEY